MEVAVQDACVDEFAVLLCLDSKMRVTVEAAFVRTVENFPVNQSPVSSQPDTTCADPAQREGYFIRLITYIFHDYNSPFYFKKTD